MYTVERKKIIRNEASIFRRDYCYSCFHLKTDTVVFNYRVLQKMRGVSLHFNSGEKI